MQRKKKILAGFLLFLILMWFCTVLSKSIYTSELPIVSTVAAERKYIEHIVELEGIVIAGNKDPVSSLGGLRIDHLMVQVGDKVEEGDVLFTIDMEDLDEIMEEKQDEIHKLQLQINTILQNQELARQKKALEEERAREDYDALARYQDTLVGRAAEGISQVEEDIDEQDGGMSDELRDQLQSAAYAEADARWNRDNTIKDAERRVEDILLPENEDATLDTLRVDLSGRQEDLSQYQEIKKQEGIVTACAGGLITDIYVSAGGRIPDTAVMLMADDSVPCQFKAVLGRDEKKYVGLNDSVTLKLEGSGKEKDLKVDYLAESETMPGSFDLYINLPEGTGMPGLSGVMTRSETGEQQPLCIPPLAVNTLETRSWVYVVKEREGILGMEYYVEEVDVKIKDRNESWVAVEGALDSESKILLSSTKAVKNGDTVRL